MGTILEVQQLQKYFGGAANRVKAVDGISFAVEQGEFVGIMGASGSGKTTLLNCLSTIDRATGGKILIEGKDITKLRSAQRARFRREKLGFVFQEFNLLDTLTAYENIALALTIAGAPAGGIDAQVKLVAKQLSIEDTLKKFPYQLSGGQRQRVACARAIVTGPALILADEPTGALDSKSASLLMKSIKTLNRDLSATVLVVTHDPSTASYCSRILLMKDGQEENSLRRGEGETRKEFFGRILQAVSALGGDEEDAI